MYVYYDRAGNLKEIINEPVRSGDLYTDKQLIYIYWDNHPTPVNSLVAKIRYGNGVYDDVELINPQLTPAQKIPYNQDRDLKFFKYNTPYRFFAFAPQAPFPSGDTAISFYFSTGGESSGGVLSGYSITTLQILPFYVETSNDLTLGDNLNKTQWSYLLNQLKLNNVRAFETLPTYPELQNLGANSLVFCFADNIMYKVTAEYELEEVAIMTPITSEHPISADLVDDTNSVHKFVTAQDLTMIGKIPENILTGTSQLLPVLMADTNTSNTDTNHNGGAYRTNLVYINTATGYVYAPKFYQNGSEVQDKLVNTVNIKSINGQSVLGSGNLIVTASALWGSIIGDITDQADLQSALSGKQNTIDTTHKLNPQYIAEDTTHRFVSDTEMASKQDTLVSGTNIKTINSTSVLGSGNISVQPVIDATHPINADYVDTTDSINKFVTDSEKTTWNGKQNALTFDSTPTQNSTNPVTSGGVYNAINSAIAGVYVYKGSLTVAQINALNTSTLENGYVYNALDNGTITTGLSNLPVVAGDNVAWDTDSMTFEQLTGIVDLSGYQPLIDNTHKLNADLVDDTSATHKFVTTQTAYTSKGSATKVPQITTNNLGQVTSITEVTITQPTVNNATLTITQNGVSKGTFTANASSNTTIALTDTTVSVSNTGTATDEVSYITVNGVEKKLAGGYEFDTDANVLSMVDDIFLDYSISVSVTNGTYSGASRIKKLGTATIVVSASSGYTLPDSITVSGATYTYNNGTIVISEPTGNVSVNVVCGASSYTVELTNSYGGFNNDAGVKYSTDGGTTWTNLGAINNTNTTVTLSNITQLQTTYQGGAVMGQLYVYNGSSWEEIFDSSTTYDLTSYLGTYQKFSVRFDT